MIELEILRWQTSGIHIFSQIEWFVEEKQGDVIEMTASLVVLMNYNINNATVLIELSKKNIH